MINTDPTGYIDLLLALAPILARTPLLFTQSDVSEALLLAFRCLLEIEAHSTLQTQRMKLLELMLVIPFPPPVVLKHLHFFVEAALRMATSPVLAQRLQGIRSLYSLVFSCGADVKPILALDANSARLNVAIQSALKLSNHTPLHFAALKLVGALGGSLRTELAAKPSIASLRHASAELLTSIQFCDVEKAIAMPLDFYVEEAVQLIAGNLLLSPNEVTCEASLRFFQSTHYSELHPESFTYCRSLLHEMKEDAFSFLEQVMRLCFPTEPLSSLVVPLDQAPKESPSPSVGWMKNETLSMLVSGIFFAAVDLDVCEKAGPLLDQLCDFLVISVLQHSRFSTEPSLFDPLSCALGPPIPPSCVKLEWEQDVIQTSVVFDSLVELLNCGLKEVTKQVISFLGQFFKSFQQLYNDPYQGFYHAIAFYDDLTVTLVQEAFKHDWKMSREVTQLFLSFMTNLPNLWTQRFFTLLIRFIFHVVSVRL